MKKGLFLCLFGAMFLCNCSNAPKMTGNPVSFQQKLEATHHWEVLANDFSKQLTLYLENNPITESGYIVHVQDGSIKPEIYIQTNDRSVFGKAFIHSLVNELPQLGYNIAYRPEAALTLRWSVQKIEHNAPRKMNSVPGTYTAISALGYGVYKLYDSASAFGAAIGTGALLDIIVQGEEYLFPDMAPKSEINMTITISDHGDLIYRQSGVYYINPEDTGHYANIPDFEGREEAQLIRKTFTVVGN